MQSNNNLPDIVNKYSNYQLKKVYVDFYKLNETDQQILEQYYLSKLKFNNLNESFQSIKQLLKNIRSKTIKARKMTVFVKGIPDQEDSLRYFIDIFYKKGYVTPIFNYSYLKAPNSFNLEAKFTTHNSLGFQIKSKNDNLEEAIEEYNKTKYYSDGNPANIKNVNEADNSVNNLKKSQNKDWLQENEISFGLKFKFNTLKREFYFTNSSWLDDYHQILFKTAIFDNLRDINRSQSGYTNKIKLIKHLRQRPFLFRDYPYFDHQNNITITAGHKLINNYIDFSSSSKKLIAGTPSQDSLKSLSITYNSDFFEYPYEEILKKSRPENLNISGWLSNVYNFKATLKFSNTINSQYYTTKLFYRRLLKLNNFFNWQFNLEAKNTFLVGNTKLLKSHETNLVDDFKGVVFPGPKLNNFTDSIGMNNYIKFYNKIYFTNTALSFDEDINSQDKNETNSTSSNYVKDEAKDWENRIFWSHQLIPFIHFNVLYHYGTVQSKFVRSKQNYESEIITSRVNDSHTNISVSKANNLDKTHEENVYSPLYYSAGVGVTYFTEFLALEAYYNSIVKKNKYDIGSEFGFNIGID